ncbi:MULTISPECIES: type IV secretion system DNA-binding domain-containing protein [Burkholderiaceae]|uniref:type IV secretion system DNA-binding domain-containing protein n=1 Tax=Burkholderiaceae TaxID=119060 RepID=UPI0009596B6F|nr:MULTISPECIES: type IV secretion system DNA-binding domain-containing protein [Burkholderiaceae]MCG1040514.1 type IV secretion system DNA-binding domain-containing protein [Mycetohabitans sp. B7]SIT64930.1 type IV conjugative transfer system coupling protein TraD [Burkholderia sp. b14]
MVKRDARRSASSFSRGAELWMHQARMFVVAIWTVALVSMIVALVVAVGYFWTATLPDERYGLERNLLAHIRDALYMTAGKMELHVNGELRKMEVADVALLTDEIAGDAWRKLRNAGVIGLLSGIGMIFLISLYWWGYGRSKMQDVKLRGAELVTGRELKKIVESRNEASPYMLAGVPMRKGSENLHTLIAGTQGTGKSQQFFSLMKQVRARGKRMIVYDPTGEFTQAFYREGKDVLMNPLDARSPNWNVWHEIKKDYHFDNLANGLIPDPAEVDPFWSLAGRMVLKDVYRVLGREGRRTNRDLYNAIAKSNLDAMHALLQGTAGATYVDPKTERTGMSLKMTVQNQLESFRFLHDSGEPFSIRSWVHEEGDSWMFITARESMREALAPLLSLWIDTAIKAVLDLEAVHRERLWFCIDELPTLQKLDILKLALTNTRKYGLCMVLGVQDFSQLYKIYGMHLASTIISGCQTKLLLRVTDGEAAELLAKLMGQYEVDEKEETLSYGLHAHRDGVSVFARRNIRNLVLTSEILKLPDMTGYLTIPGDFPIAKVSYNYVPTPKIASGFIERTGLAVDFKPKYALSAVANTSAEDPADKQPATEQAAKADAEKRPAVDLLDEDDVDGPTATVTGGKRNANGETIDPETGKARPRLHVKDDAAATDKPGGKHRKPLADAL